VKQLRRLILLREAAKHDEIAVYFGAENLCACCQAASRHK